MTLRFTDIMRRHHATQTAFREKCKAQIGRQLLIGEATASTWSRPGSEPANAANVAVNQEPTDEELEQMLDRHRLAVFMSHVSTEDVAAATVTPAAGN